MITKTMLPLLKWTMDYYQLCEILTEISLLRSRIPLFLISPSRKKLLIAKGDFEFHDLKICVKQDTYGKLVFFNTASIIYGECLPVITYIPVSIMPIIKHLDTLKNGVVISFFAKLASKTIYDKNSLDRSALPYSDLIYNGCIYTITKDI